MARLPVDAILGDPGYGNRSGIEDTLTVRSSHLRCLPANDANGANRFLFAVIRAIRGHSNLAARH